ncbi:WhiB family transcriptional regulator [Nonomuraea sp. NPDC004580]|uniref:WhiB family transcriptional regulator n=1 Tax=Nonomuraea sp. NPDC004580 TaxID=3154552 RepID=UPI0033B7EC74
MSPTPRTVERARTVARLQRAGYTQDVIAYHLGVTSRTVARLHITSKTLPPEEEPMASIRTWSDRAACRTADPELFFPLTYNDAKQIKRAKSFCHACPALQDCLNYALDNPDRTTDGIWGGTTPEERRRIRLAERTTAA